MSPVQTNLLALVHEFGAALPGLELADDEQEEYSAVLLWFQNTIRGRAPNPRIVDECIAYLRPFNR